MTKRRVILLLLLLMAGAIVNVAVAWVEPYVERRAVTDAPTLTAQIRHFHATGTGLPIRAMRWNDDGRVMHWTLIWPGFAINTLFYAAVLWLLFAAPFALRRRRRIQRGLCPKCAYPVGSSNVCTECGAAVTQKAVSA